MANELAGKFFLKTNLEAEAFQHFQEASRLYQKWGALTKVKQLEEQYPTFFPQAPQEICNSYFKYYGLLVFYKMGKTPVIRSLSNKII